MRTTLARFAVAAALALAAGAAAAQYPSKPIHIVVGFPPGGGNDIIARLLGAKMQQDWGQPVVVDNKPGAASIVAAEYVVHSAADGYTLFVNATGGMSVNPVIYKKLPYDSLRDFSPISMIGLFPLVLAVNPSLPVHSVKELIAYAKANPGKLNYSSGSSSFQLATEMFKQMTGTDIRHIPYKGSAASINAVLSGDVQMTIVDAPPAIAQIRGGRLRALAVTSLKRMSALPEVPTLDESGVPGYEMVLWIGLFAPAGTPADVVAKLHAETARIVALPDVRERLDGLGVEPVGGTPEQLAERIRAEIARFGPVAKKANIHAD